VYNRLSSWQGVPGAGFPHYVLIPKQVDIQLGAEGSGADEWQAEAAQDEAARLRLGGAAVDIFDSDELPAHLVRAAPCFSACVRAPLCIEHSTPGLCATHADVLMMYLRGNRHYQLSDL
jgi:hypothetical protein